MLSWILQNQRYQCETILCYNTTQSLTPEFCIENNNARNQGLWNRIEKEQSAPRMHLIISGNLTEIHWGQSSALSSPVLSPVLPHPQPCPPPPQPCPPPSSALSSPSSALSSLILSTVLPYPQPCPPLSSALSSPVLSPVLPHPQPYPPLSSAMPSTSPVYTACSTSWISLKSTFFSPNSSPPPKSSFCDFFPGPLQ